MAEKIRKFMRSERGRAFVNAMFILATMVRGSGMMFLADIFWVVWLLFCIRVLHTVQFSRNCFSLFLCRRDNSFILSNHV